MSHGLFDGIGLPLDDEGLLEFIGEQWGEIRGAVLPGDRLVGDWLDPSGARLIVCSDDGALWAVPAFAAPAGARVTGIVTDPDCDPDYVAVDLLDSHGEIATRLCAALGQWACLQPGDEDVVMSAAVTALSRNVAIYEDADTFLDSDDSVFSDEEPVRRLAVGSFIPDGLFGDPRLGWGVGMVPLASFVGQVEDAETLRNSVSGLEFHAVTVTLVGVFWLTACWPAGRAPLPAVGNVIKVDGAYLTLVIDELWDRLTDSD